MSWEDFKKEKQQNSSWEEFKQNREKLVQVSNNKTPTNSISQNIKNFTSDTGRTFSNLGIGSKIGVKQSLNFAYKVGENRNKTEQQVKNERVLGSRELTNTEKALYIAQQQSKSVDPKNLNNEASKNVILPMLNNNILTYNNTKVEEVANSNILDRSINKDQLKIQENIENQTNNFSKKLAELAPSIGNMGVGTAISALNPVAGMSYFTTSAGGSYMQDALDRGMTREQATTYGAIMGLMEGATEAIGVENLSKAGKGLKALVSGAGITATKEGAEQIAKNSIKTVLKDYGIGIADNVMQEAIIEPIQEVVAGAIGGKDKANWNDMGQRMLKAGIDGGLTSAILGGANLGIQSCVGVIEKTTNGQSVTQQEIQTAVKEASTQLDVTKMIEDSTQQEINKYNTLSGQSQLTQNQQNENIQQITPIMQKNAQNGILEQNNSILNNKDVPMLNYQYEKSDNIKINNLRQDAGKYFNNSEQARNYVSMLEQIITDKNVDIRLDSDLRTPDGQVANGSYSNGVITINPNSTKSGEFIAVHELTHAIGTDSMKNIIETYRKSNAEFNTAVENLLQNYNSTELTDEALSDVSAQLFGNQEFIANVSQNNHNIFKRIYNEIKYLWHQFRGYKNQNQFIDDLYYKWTQAYNSNNKLNETSNYSIAGKQGMINAIKTDTGNLELERNYNKAQQMQENGIDNETIRQSTGWFQDRNGDWKFEFSDRDMSLKKIRFKENSTYKLENILKHDTLFTIYPELANYNVKFTDLNKANGVYNIFDKDIKINNNLLSKKQYKSSIEGTLIHEIQHAIQDIENFEGGRSSKGSKLAYYESLGEIEASDTKARFLQERHKNIDLTDIAPESSKTNPKHQNLDKYLKNRKLLDKAKDGVYNYIKKRNGGNNEFSKENISKNKKQNMGLVDGRRRGRYVDEYEIENITNAGKNNEKNTLENNREDRGIYRDRINNSVQESENNSDSFSLQDNYGRKLSKEQQYLNKNFKTTGTRTNLQDIKNLAPIEKNVNDNKGIKAPIMQKQQNGSINAPISKEVKAIKHYKSIMESQYTSSEAKTIAKELMGTDTYVPDSNNSQLERANERILNSTPESELNSFMSKAINGEKITATDIAVGEKLIQYYSKTGDKTKLQDAIQATAMAGTSAGQTVQALSLLNHQTPEGQAIWLQRSVDKMNNDLKKTRGKNAEQFNLTEDMIDKIVNSKDNDDLQNNLNDVYKQLGQQVSKTNLQKIDAWRYFSMLANPKTHIRNIVGNTAMAGVQGVKNKVAGAIEGTISKVNPNMERNHTIVSANKKVTTFAKNDIKNVADRLGLNENKYNPKTRLENSMRTFKSDTLENTIGKLFGLNDNLLEAEDGWGLKAGYTKALSEYMTANNLNPNTITDKQLAKARNYAVEQAQEATFHQASAIASSLNQFQNKNRLTKFIIGSTLPFKKTPINVAKAGLEYSPVGLTKSLIYDTVKLRKGNITVNKYIDNISKGLTGTGIALLGYALADAGILKASGSDDTDKEKYDEEMGKQTYSITIAGNTYSLDWLAPTGIPLFIGAECHELMQTEKEEKTSSSDENSKYSKALKSATNILDSFTNAMNPMTEMSMLSGLTSALKSYEQGSSQMIASLGTNAVKSYVNQFVPTALGQIARTTDKYERDTTSTKTGVLPKAIDSTKNQIINKTPALRQILPIKTDIWGNEVKQSDNIIQRELENAVLPWTRKEVDTTKVDNALMELYDETGESSILPDTLDKKLTINGQNYRLTNEEYSKYKTAYGKTSYNLLNSLVSSSEYKSMSNSQKQTAIESIYDYAKEKNKVDYAQSVNETIKTSTNYNILEELRKAGESQTQYLSYSSETKEIQGEKANQKKNKLLLDANYSSKAKSIIYQNTTGKNDDTYRILNKLDSSKNIINQYLDYLQADLKADREDDSTENGKAISGSKKQKVYNYINSIDSKDMSYVQRLYLTGVNTTLSTSDKKKIFTLINENKSLTKNEKLEALDKLQGFTVYKDGKVAW
jgi:hypothetical protein|nr:MAG TPA: Large polyvalent protein associated domain 23 [Caudoviricetes sp.]